jgi:1,4-dihydroxy-2-naphthoate octaprenyltransferase
MVGMVCSSLVVVAVIAILNSQIGRDIEDDLAASARTLIAAPAVIAAVVAFCASMLALLPAYRRRALQVAAIAGWVVAAWLVMAAVILAGIKFATERVS